MRYLLLAAALAMSGCASTADFLERVNERAKLAPGNCQDHVLSVARLLDGQYSVRGFYTESSWYRRGGHVSALVETSAGTYILDNGALQQSGDVTAFGDLEVWWRSSRIGELPPGTRAASN